MKAVKTYKIKGMHCASCAMLIEGELEDRGFTSRCTFAKDTVEVDGPGDSSMDDKVKEAVEAAGYTLA